ncbi:TonB-dependent receptor plug domain-containing protein [Corallincola platygyrae]|uniref:TonB-dependent receptor plug domain-containing protein n=1 Tax=Corallincola platygyrae TaxID=1193278 RepID=A0ABW4XJZ8_9GAMM
MAVKPGILMMGAALTALSPVLAADELSSQDLFELDLDQLMQLQVESSATYTPTSERRMPAATTRITPQMIQDSGARNLFDLLETYVPNFHYLPHHWESSHMGMRSIISDRDDKYLIVVNGRVMNEQTHFGALSERDLPMLDDIRRIEVVRGPGSVVYGPGALSMVINIQTESFANNSGDSVTAKVGFEEEFQSLELKKSIAFSGEDHGILMYAGVSNYNGADRDDSPVVYGNSDTTAWGEPINAGDDSTLSNPRNRASFRDKPKLKLHLDYQLQDFRAWLRYTQGGEQMAWSPKIVTLPPNGFADEDTQEEDLSTHQVGYEQWMLDLSYRWALQDHLWLDLKGGYDTTEYIRILFDNQLPDNPPENHREENYYSRAMLNWQPAEAHSLAIGGEFVRSQWGLDTWGYPDAPAISPVLGEMERWRTDRWALIGEYQWQIAEKWSAFFGVRLDKDEYTDDMWSPRAAVVWEPSEQDTVKAIFSRSVRKNNAEELRMQHTGGVESDPEELSGVELIYDRRVGELKLGGNLFYNDVEVIGIDTNSLRSSKVADYDFWGLEIETVYEASDWDIRFSHSYTKLLDFSVEPGKSQKLSVAHLGYGNDLSNWSNHITKLAAAYQWDEKWRFSGAVRVFWDYPGAEQTTLETNDKRDASEDGNSSSTALSDRGYTDSFEEAIFVDLGAHYQLTPDSKISVNGYNLLGLFDDKYNKRMYLINVSNYRADAAAVAISYRLNF